MNNGHKRTGPNQGSAPLSTDSATAERSAKRMGAMLVGMGALHMVVPKPFDAIVPRELPGRARFYTVASGVMELGTGAMLLAPKTRKTGALLAAALFTAVFPANVNMVRLWRDRSAPMRALAIARLPLQIPMVTSALKIWRAER